MIIDRIKKKISGEMRNMLSTTVKKAIFEQIGKLEKLAKSTKDFPYDDLFVQLLRELCEDIFGTE